MWGIAVERGGFSPFLGEETQQGRMKWEQYAHIQVRHELLLTIPAN